MPSLLDKIYSRKKFFSPNHGEIIVKKFFSNYRVMTGNFFQTGPYVNRLWRKLLRAVPRRPRPKKVLLLGLGGGGAVREISRRWRKVNIVAVEYDPIMVEIAREAYLKNFESDSFQIVISPAEKYIHDCREKFDIIVVDLFNGKAVSPQLQNKDFVLDLKNILANDGYALVNFDRSAKELIPGFDQYLSRHRNIQYITNTTAVYRQFGRGNISDPLPKGFVAKEQSRLYFATELDPRKDEVIGQDLNIGVRTRVGFITLEKYVGPQEPEITRAGALKLITWQPLGAVKKKERWFRLPFFGERRQLGVAKIENENYWQEWSLRARRQRKKWLEEKNFEMFETDINTFKTAYRGSIKGGLILGIGFLRVLDWQIKHGNKYIHLFVVRRSSDQKIVAGLAVMDYPDVSESCHTISFIKNEVRNTAIGVGMIDYWYGHCLKNNIQFPNFGRVWQKGDPHSWKGFSEFKQNFNIHQIIYDKPYYKIIF